MAVLTIDDIKALDFGYLTGVDLVKYCPIQFLINQETKDQGAIESAVLTAYAEIIGSLVSRLDIKSEYIKIGADRSLQVVKLTSLSAIRNITSNLPEIPMQMKANFELLDKTLLAIRNGQMSMPSLTLPQSDKCKTQVSSTHLINQRYISLG